MTMMADKNCKINHGRVLEREKNTRRKMLMAKLQQLRRQVNPISTISLSSKVMGDIDSYRCGS